jgi:hypothetical protein
VIKSVLKKYIEKYIERKDCFPAQKSGQKNKLESERAQLKNVTFIRRVRAEIQLKFHAQAKPNLE